MDALTRPREPASFGRVAQGQHDPSVRQRLRWFIADSFFVDEIGDDESFLASGIVDSLGISQVVAFVESELGTSVPDADLLPANFDSIDRIAAYVERRRQAA